MPWPVKQAKCSAIAFVEPIILAINYLQSRRENVYMRLTFVSSKSDTRRNIIKTVNIIVHSRTLRIVLELILWFNCLTFSTMFSSFG